MLLCLLAGLAFAEQAAALAMDCGQGSAAQAGSGGPSDGGGVPTHACDLSCAALPSMVCSAANQELVARSEQPLAFEAALASGDGPAPEIAPPKASLS